MEYKFTRHQVPRKARPDAEAAGKIYLIKNVKELRATYQVRLLAFNASTTGRKLILKLPKKSRLAPSLKELIRDLPNVIKREPL
ncbi:MULTISPECIES: hypothetical protein [unclassified Bradyrhizobium]